MLIHGLGPENLFRQIGHYEVFKGTICSVFVWGDLWNSQNLQMELKNPDNMIWKTPFSFLWFPYWHHRMRTKHYRCFFSFQDGWLWKALTPSETFDLSANSGSILLHLYSPFHIFVVTAVSIFFFKVGYNKSTSDLTFRNNFSNLISKYMEISNVEPWWLLSIWVLEAQRTEHRPHIN